MQDFAQLLKDLWSSIKIEPRFEPVIEIEPATVNVTVEQPSIEIQAPRVELTTPRPEVTVSPIINVAPANPTIHVNAPAVSPVINVEPSKHDIIVQPASGPRIASWNFDIKYPNGTKITVTATPIYI